MISDSQQSAKTEHKPIPFGSRLQSARESLGFERRDVAAQLRLNEKVIIMMEKDKYPIDLPDTFIRGYIRSYAKLLQIPEVELIDGLDTIKPKANLPNVTSTTSKNSAPVTSGNYFMQIFTYLIIFTMIGLVGVWWYTHTNVSLPILMESQTHPEASNPNPFHEEKQTAASVIPVAPTVNVPIVNTPEDTPPDNNSSPSESEKKPDALQKTHPIPQNPDHTPTVVVIPPNKVKNSKGAPNSDEMNNQQTAQQSKIPADIYLDDTEIMSDEGIFD